MKIYNKTIHIFLAAWVTIFSIYTTCINAAEIVVLGLFKDAVILRADGKQYKLNKGESTPQGIKLISSNSDNAVLEINGKRTNYALGSHISASGGVKNSAGKKVDEARIWPLRGMYSTAGSINGQVVYFLVDTGATFVSMSSEQAKRLGIDYHYKGEPSTASTANGVVRIFRVNLDMVKVDDIELRNVQGAVIEGNSSREVLLGMSFLRRTKIEYHGDMMLLKKKL